MTNYRVIHVFVPLQSTSNASAFAVSRGMEQLGGSLSCSTSRDHVFYHMDVLRDSVSDGFTNLAAVATSTEFRPWELVDNVRRSELDLSMLNEMPEARE